MKHFLILFFLLPAFLHADAGGCVVYKAKYVLKNGSSVTAYLPLSGYEDYAYLDEQTNRNAYCSDKAFQQLLNKVIYRQQKKPVFVAYTNLYTVKYGPAVQHSPACAFTDSSALVSLHLDSIRYTIFLSAKPAPWDYPEYAFLILDSATSLRLQNQQVVNTSWLHCEPVPEPNNAQYTHLFSDYLVLNLNRELSVADVELELKKIHAAFYDPERKQLNEPVEEKRKLLYKAKLAQQKAIMLELRKKGLVLVEQNHVC
jgi:hypothetical protein